MILASFDNFIIVKSKPCPIVLTFKVKANVQSNEEKSYRSFPNGEKNEFVYMKIYNNNVYPLFNLNNVTFSFHACGNRQCIMAIFLFLTCFRIFLHSETIIVISVICLSILHIYTFLIM